MSHGRLSALESSRANFLRPLFRSDVRDAIGFSDLRIHNVIEFIGNTAWLARALASSSKPPHYARAAFLCGLNVCRVTEGLEPVNVISSSSCRMTSPSPSRKV
jgi:hypothetical protein